MRFRLSLITAAGAVALIALLALVLVLMRGDPPDPAAYPIRGIDVSHHQGPIDWEQVATSGIDFAFLKATEGRDFRDPRFEENWQAAERVGIPRGAYHFFTFCTKGADQAAHFLEVVPPEGGAIIPAIDVEYSGNCSSYGELDGIRDELLALLQDVERAWGRKPIIYVTLRSRVRVLDDRFSGYPIWQRNVFWEMPPSRSLSWSVWQYADDESVAGISGPVDGNVLAPDLTVSSLRQAAR